MPSLATPTDFIGQNNIPDKDLIATNLQWFIDKFEPKLFELLLGTALYASYVADPTTARFVAIKATYLHPASIDYCYWWYLDDQGVQLTSMGASQAKKKNAISVSPYPKMVRAWNEMAEINRKLYKYLHDNASTYPEYTINFPEWFYGWGFWNGVWMLWFFDWNDWTGEFGACVPEVYRFKNRIGL